MISKGLLVSSNSPEKQTDKLVWENLTTPKSPFKIIRPLANSIIAIFILHHLVRNAESTKFVEENKEIMVD